MDVVIPEDLNRAFANAKKNTKKSNNIKLEFISIHREYRALPTEDSHTHCVIQYTAKYRADDGREFVAALIYDA